MFKPSLLEEDNMTTEAATATAEVAMAEASKKRKKTFLNRHMDTSRHTALFSSVSKEKASVIYNKDNRDVTELTVPPGLSVIVTTEIYSGLNKLNPVGLKHCSESKEEHLLMAGSDPICTRNE